jgi:hypothetical protein
LRPFDHRLIMRSSLLIALSAVCGLTAHANAQSGGRTRAQLQASVLVADSAHRTEEASRLRARLATGDFQVGDRIIVTYEGVGLQRGDTLIVQDGRVLRLNQPLGELSLVGVLRSEITDSISARVAKFYKNIVVRTVPLVRVSISGAVRTPGFYYVPSDTPLSDVIMRSGGQDQQSDLENTVVMRGTETLWGAEDVRAALRSGDTLDALSIEQGDDIAVGAHGGEMWSKAFQFGLPVLSAIIIQLLIRR